MERKDDMLTLEQAAEYAGVKLRTVQWAAQKGYLDTLPIPSRFKLTTREKVLQSIPSMIEGGYWAAPLLWG